MRRVSHLMFKYISWVCAETEQKALNRWTFKANEKKSCLHIICFCLCDGHWDLAGHYHYTHIVKGSHVRLEWMTISVQCPNVSLKFHPSAFVVHSEGREDKQVRAYKEIIPAL